MREVKEIWGGRGVTGRERGSCGRKNSILRERFSELAADD
jgi:hypothetical protein